MKLKKIRRTLFVSMAALLLICSVVYGVYFFDTGQIDDSLRSGKLEQTENALSHWAWLPLVSGAVYEKRGTAKLLEKGIAAATPDFQEAEQKILFHPSRVWMDVLKILWSNGRYEDGLGYAHHIQESVGKDPSFHYYLAGFLAGKNQLSEALKELSEAGNLEMTSRNLLLSAEIQHRLTHGDYVFVMDRKELPLVSLTLDHRPTFLFEQIRPVIQNATGDYLEKLKQDPYNPAILTIDYRIQNAAEIALGKYAGAIVLLDVKTGDILAAASKTKGLESDYPSGTAMALNNLYEPGSIIKLITFAAALEHGVDLNKLFPLQCDGSMKLSDGEVFYDWDHHGLLKDINAATAVSCNVAFAKLGMMLKPADLLANLQTFGFDSKLTEAFLPLELGKVTQAELNEHYISYLSIGLQYLQMTPLHAAMLASAIANGGQCVMPRLLLERQNIVGIPFQRQPVVPFRRFMSEKSASAISAAMEDVIQNPEGTGRRAAVNGFRFAMKTGTAGDVRKGYNSIVIGFGPLPSPKIAFAIFVEHSGKAEFEGASITKLFLESIQGYIN